MSDSWKLGRRTLLRGAGAMLGLPLLEAMIPGGNRAHAQAMAPPKRLVFVTFGTGTPEYQYGRPGVLTPSTTGSNYALTPLLQPLADLRDDFMVITGLHNSVAYADGYDVGDHNLCTFALLTGTTPTASYTAGISVDQVAANHLAQYTPALPSLLLDSVFEPNSYAHSRWLSWAGPSSPRAPTLDSGDAFRQVFGNPTLSDQARQKQLVLKRSVLHQAKDDADRLRAKLGTADRNRLDQYLTSVESLERRVTAASMTASQCAGSGTPIVDPGVSDPTTRPDRTRQMMDLMVLAMQCDRTRVCNFMLGHTGMYTQYGWLPPWDRLSFHDDISHGPQVADPVERESRMDGYVAVTKWNIEQFAYLVRKLKATPEGSGTMLDNTLLVLTSEMTYGHGHAVDHLPVIVAGRGGGACAPGRHLSVAEQPIANLWLSMLQSVGVNASSFGNSTASLSLT